jgi:hypothetical protein
MRHTVLALLSFALLDAPAQAATAPTPHTAPASNIGPLSATLNGDVNANGHATTIHFQYGTTKNYGQTTPKQQIGAGTTPIPVAASIAGLKSGTRYHYRLVATSSLGTAVGDDETFTTRDPRVRGRYRVRLRIRSGGRPFGQRRGEVVHRLYRFRPRCDGALCQKVKLVRRGKRGRFKSGLVRAHSGLYVGTERFRGGYCNDGLRFRSAARIRVKVKRTAGDRASRIRGRLAVKLRGCVSGTERARLRGRARG